MYKSFFIYLFLISNITVLVSQNSDELLNSSIDNFSNLSNKEYNYELNFIKDKKTLIFKISRENFSSDYKILLRDIHPEGIFFENEKHHFNLKILSIDNGNKFIADTFRNDTRFSKTTNIVEINNISLKKKQVLCEFVKNFRNYMKALYPKAEESEEIQIIVPKSKNK